MVAWGTLIVGLLAFTALATVLFRHLLAATVSQRISALIATAVYWLALAVLVLPIWWTVTQFANHLYSTYPSLWVAAWDIGLVWVFVSGGWLSVAIGFVFACRFSWRVWFMPSAQALSLSPNPSVQRDRLPACRLQPAPYLQR